MSKKPWKRKPAITDKKQPAKKTKKPGQEPPASVQPGQEPPASVQPGQEPPASDTAKSEILDTELLKVLEPPASTGPGPEPPASTGPGPEDFKTFQDGVKGIFDVIAAKAGEHWRIDDREAATISKPLTKIFYKYAPNFQYSDEMFLAVALGSIILPRINHKPDESRPVN